MPASQDAMVVARNAAWVDRVRYHLTRAAADVMAEPSNTAGHAARVAYAAKVLSGTADYQSAAVAILTNTTIAAAIAPGAEDFGIGDQDLPFVTNSLFGALAGVSAT